MIKLSKLAELTGGVMSGNDINITGLSVPDEQKQDTVCILSKSDMASYMSGAASAYVVPEDFHPAGSDKPFIRVKKTREALVVMLIALYPVKALTPGISLKADISDSAVTGVNVCIEAFAVIGAGSSIGDNSCIKSGAVIGDNVTIGKNCVIYPQVTIYDNTVIGDNVSIHAGAVIGTDGFGYIPGAEHKKIPHVGNVRIENNVEIGASTCIDRATIGSTVIGAGTKIDNLVQIGHNVRVGRGCLFASQCGISGSTVIGDYVTLGGQVGLADHINISSHAMIMAQSGVGNDVPEKAVFGGYPAVPRMEWAKQVAVVKQLPELKKRIIALEKEAK